MWKIPAIKACNNQQYYNDMDIMSLTNKTKTSADGNVANEFTKEEESEEALAIGLFAGGSPSPGSDPVVVGTTEDLGVGVPAPLDWGEGDGANIESLVTELGGAISGGNCCAPASFFKNQTKNNLRATMIKSQK